MGEEDLSVDVELAKRQCAKLRNDGTAALEDSIASTEAWAEQQTVERWGTEPGAVAFRLAYRSFLECVVNHLRGDIAELKEFTSRLEFAIRNFQNSEEELEDFVEGMMEDIADAQSREGRFQSVQVVPDLGGVGLPPTMRME